MLYSLSCIADFRRPKVRFDELQLQSYISFPFGRFEKVCAAICVSNKQVHTLICDRIGQLDLGKWRRRFVRNRIEGSSSGFCDDCTWGRGNLSPRWTSLASCFTLAIQFQQPHGLIGAPPGRERPAQRRRRTSSWPRQGQPIAHGVIYGNRKPLITL